MDRNCLLQHRQRRDVCEAHGHLTVSGTNCVLFVNTAECNGLYLSLRLICFPRLGSRNNNNVRVLANYEHDLFSPTVPLRAVINLGNLTLPLFISNNIY